MTDHDSRILIFGDLHSCHTGPIERTIDEVRPDLTIFLGDYFDHFGDTLEETACMARWLEGSLNHENRIHLIGNHDLPYLYEGYMSCQGYSVEKSLTIANALNLDLWRQRAKVVYWLRRDLLLSHAGLSRKWFPENEIDVAILPRWLDLQLKDAWKALFDKNQSRLHPIWQIGSARDPCGESCGGLVWCDFDSEFEPVPGLCQVFGHTPGQVIRNKATSESSFNFCIDTSGEHGEGPKQALLLTGEDFEVIKIGD